MTTETEELRFNTGIAFMMEFVNGVYKNWGDSRCVFYLFETEWRVLVPNGCTHQLTGLWATRWD